MPLPSTIDRYRIVGEIGRGAMGTVYRAHDPRLDREVALKTISGVVEEGTQGDELTVRFEREARVAARLRHPNVVAVHDAGRDGDRLFLVLELVEGESLAGRLARGAFPDRAEALELAAQAADALAAAHSAGIIHRDIKPGNLLIARDGRVLVTDFGIAKALGETSELTRTGMVVGSPAYLSPEQVQGMPLDGRSDLFSLGVVLFELVLRRKPFAAETFTSLVYQILTVDPLAEGEDLHTLPPELATLLRDALAKDREHRMPDARIFSARAREIARALPERSAVSAPTIVFESGSAPARPAPAAAAAPLQVQPPARTLPPPPPASPVHWTPPATPSAPPYAAPPPVISATAPTVLAASGVGTAARRSGTLQWRGFLLGVLVAVSALAALTLLRDSRRAPATPEAGAPPPKAILDSARPLAQPEASAARRAAPAKVEAVAEPAAEPATTAAAASPLAAPPPAVVPAAAPVPMPAPVSTYRPPAPAPERVEAAPAPVAAPVVDAPPAPVEAPPVRPAEPALAGVFETRGAAEFHVDPGETIITIEGVRIGTADEWDGMGGGRKWIFKNQGSHLIRLDAEGYHSAWIRVVVKPDAEEKVVDVDTELEEIE